MNERQAMDPFEQRVARLARAYTEPAVRPVDPLETARAAMRAPAGRWAALPGARTFERAALPSLDRRLPRLLVAAGLVITLALLALAGGSMLRPRDPGRIVFVRDGDLFVSAIEGTGATRIREGGADGTRLGYLAALWSPDTRHIAAVHDRGGPTMAPGVDILAADGTSERSIDAGAGGTPWLSWSPDSRRLAIATYAAAVKTDAADPTAGVIRLAIVGLDGGSRDVVVPLAPWFANAEPEIWTLPDLLVRWSPDGRWIAVAWEDASGVRRWHLVAADGSAVRPLGELVEGRCRVLPDFIDWFPDGQRLAMVGDLAGDNELCVEALGSGNGGAGATPEPGTVAAIPDDPGSNLHGELNLPNVAPDGDRVAISTFTDDVDTGRHVTTLRVYDLASGRATDVASGVETLILDPSGEASVTSILEGNPVWMSGIAWSADGRRLLYLSPEPGVGPKTWTVRAVDAAGGSPSSVVLEGVRSYDLGYPH
jgi:Tol biopolymer transport system component